jgi:hypothetical protein
MNAFVTEQVTSFLAVIEQAGVPSLRIGFTLAVIVFLLAGVFIRRSRRQFFDPDSNVETDVSAVRHNREETVIFCLERPNAGSAYHPLRSLQGMT